MVRLLIYFEPTTDRRGTFLGVLAIIDAVAEFFRQVAVHSVGNIHKHYLYTILMIEFFYDFKKIIVLILV